MKEEHKKKQKQWLEPKIRKIKLDERQILLACPKSGAICGIGPFS